MNMDKKLSMEFDLNTLDHLGIKLYRRYPPIVAELVSNSWDADAENVTIKLFSLGKKEEFLLEVADNGNGMSYDELQEKYLRIGRNRRSEPNSDLSPVFNRKVLGKKGIGKLSMFGLANTITISTVKNNKKNVVIMKYTDIKSSESKYYPEQVIVNEVTKDSPGTSIMLTEINRADSFKFDYIKLGVELSRRFSIFDEDHFKTVILYNDETELQVTNALKYSNIEIEDDWKVPEFLKGVDDVLYSYFFENNINGNVYTTKQTMNEDTSGITLLARKKLAEENSFFNNRAKDFFHNYCFGFLNVDFIDEDAHEDYISTDRKSVLWELPLTQELSVNLNKLLNIIQKQWRSKRRENKLAAIKEISIINIDKWLSDMNAMDKSLASKLVNTIVSDNKMETEQAAVYMEHIKDVFSYETFKHSATEILESDEENIIGMLKIISDWELIESKELAKVAEGRIATINNFKKVIDTNASETKVIQPFFETFPWLLDPKMTTFEREYTISKAIKENIIDKEAKNYGANVLKRMDFFVTQNENVYRIFELKRPDTVITKEMIANIQHYIIFTQSFLKTKQKLSPPRIKAFLGTNKTTFKDDVQYELDLMQNQGDLVVISYNELLVNARNYNIEFIKKYDELQESQDE